MRSAARPQRLSAAALVLASGLALCGATPLAAQGCEGCGPLDPLLIALAQGTSGDDFPAAVPQVTWTGPSYPTDSEADNSVTWYQIGRVVLAGFGAAPLPQGVGADQTVRQGNEGDSGVTVQIHSLRGVQSVAVRKFYPDADYLDVLTRQTDAAITPLAANCAQDAYGSGPDTEATAFFRLDLPQGQPPVFASAARIEDAGKMGPGYTTYTFFLNDPAAMIAEMGCRADHP